MSCDSKFLVLPTIYIYCDAPPGSTRSWSRHQHNGARFTPNITTVYTEVAHLPDIYKPVLRYQRTLAALLDTHFGEEVSARECVGRDINF